MPKQPKLEILLYECSQETLDKISEEAKLKQFAEVYRASSHRKQRKLDKVLIRVIATVAKRHNVGYIVTDSSHLQEDEED